MSEAAGWDEAYQREAPAPWDIGRPQPVVAELAEQGRLTGDLLDAGCGTGEHTLLAAVGGAQARGIDLSPVAIERARAKAAGRGIDIPFEAADLLTVQLPEAAFDVVLDSGVFHSFDDEGRERYVRQLRRWLKPGGILFLICFSDRQPGEWGPRRVSRAKIESAFASGWSLQQVRACVFDINPLPDADEVQAWLVEATAS